MTGHPTCIAMVPARMGSQRLAQKNLRLLGGLPLITRAVRNCRKAGVFDQVWINSEHPTFGEIAVAEGVGFHQRPEALGNDQATSEDFVREFLIAHPCEWLFQVHSIAPLLGIEEMRAFVTEMQRGDVDVLLSVVDERLECFYRNAPVNFSLSAKTNSQDLDPVRRISWSITGWQRQTFLEAAENGQCATYAGRLGLFPISRLAGHVIKTAEDLAVAEALLPLSEPDLRDDSQAHTINRS